MQQKKLHQNAAKAIKPPTKIQQATRTIVCYVRESPLFFFSIGANQPLGVAEAPGGLQFFFLIPYPDRRVQNTGLPSFSPVVARTRRGRFFTLEWGL